MLPYRFVAYDPKCLWSLLLTLGPTITLGAGRRQTSPVVFQVASFPGPLAHRE